MSAICITKHKQPWRNAVHTIETKRLTKGHNLFSFRTGLGSIYMYLYSKIWMIEQEPETPVMYVV